MDIFLLKMAFALSTKTHLQIWLMSGINRQAPCLIMHFCTVVLLCYYILNITNLYQTEPMHQIIPFCTKLYQYVPTCINMYYFVPKFTHNCICSKLYNFHLPNLTLTRKLTLVYSMGRYVTCENPLWTRSVFPKVL